MKRFYFLVIAAFVAIHMQISANTLEEKDTGVPINQPVPALSAIGIDGSAQNLAQLSGQKGTILIFHRSADWCPYCKRHLIEFNKWNNKFAELGYNLVAISYDSVEVLKRFTEKEGIQYALIADQNQQTMKSFEVLNTDYEPGHRHYGIPFPGVMVVNKSGILTYKYFYQGYKHRVVISDLYEKLKNQ
ncbi:peroxiredoxin family protein [Aliikangiella marina]|uniref:Peroxiredoxin family protein n=1 Tax=Aliikangiella marina TaxID=1712262 RepID=A0A545T4C0_9GAMM|nr:peroxiredoxin family protein [Aliikangiella marina]TQV72021.1 peroxiredoxin family protein [Aliikangiella marina]TQV72074.1 peroxiredoxin family protein [Aliikangiella marina]